MGALDTSERQAAANRKNALRSTGPRTAEGKEASKYNAIQQYLELARRARERAEGCFPAPYEGTSLAAVRSGQVDDYRQAQQEAEQAEARAASVAAPCAAAFDGRATSLANLSRYETTLERGLFKALHELERLQARRGGQAVPPPAVVDLNLEWPPTSLE